jgi:GT2 family glycosyltransferase
VEHPNQQPLPDALRNYELWSQLTRVGEWEMTRMRNEASLLANRPLISMLLSVNNPRHAWLEQALDSMMSQTYPYWELCVCNDGSTDAQVEEILSLYERLDERIRVRHLQENVGTARATNEAFSLSTGKFVGLMNQYDALAPHALFEVVTFLQERPDADLIYTDEDKIYEAGNSLKPHFKPGWSPDFALGVNYLMHLSIYRRSILEEIGGWRDGFDGAQDLDLMLRYTERTDSIYHLPKILYHWRSVEGSVAMDMNFEAYTHERARSTIQDALERRKISGRVIDGFIPNSFRIEREIEGEPTVSVLLLPREGADHTRCVASLERNATYSNYEVLLLEGEPNSLKTKGLPERAKVVRTAEASSPLDKYNTAVEQTEGEYVLLLDPYLEALSEGWLEALIQHAQRAEIGAVGGKLVAKEGHTLQAGLILNPEANEDLPQLFYRPYNRWHPGFRLYLDLTRNCSAVSSSCMMFRKEAFETIGGFDAKHLEDTFGDIDLCLRLRERDYLIVYTPYAEFVQHRLKSTTGLKPDQAHYVWERWSRLLENDPYYNPNLLWTARDVRSVLDLIGLSNRARS